jgi:hypothetical protein
MGGLCFDSYLDRSKAARGVPFAASMWNIYVAQNTGRLLTAAAG